MRLLADRRTILAFPATLIVLGSTASASHSWGGYHWARAEFWPNRLQTTTQHEIQMPTGATEVERARDLMRQLGIVGEIQWPVPPPTFQFHSNTNTRYRNGRSVRKSVLNDLYACA